MSRRPTRRDNRNRPARGERNNNPLNIRWLPPERAWRGQELEPDAPGGFGVYETPEDGIRAAILQIRRHIDRGHDTVEKLVRVWAPASENDTGRYVETVASALALSPGDNVDPEDGETLLDLARAMAEHENGYIPYDDGTWYRGLTAAGLGVAPRTSLLQSRTIGGAAVGGGASAAGLVAGLLQDNQDTVVSGLQAIATGPNVIAAVCALVALMSAGYVMYVRWTDHRDGLR